MLQYSLLFAIHPLQPKEKHREISPSAGTRRRDPWSPRRVGFVQSPRTRPRFWLLLESSGNLNLEIHLQLAGNNRDNLDMSRCGLDVAHLHSWLGFESSGVSPSDPSRGSGVSAAQGPLLVVVQMQPPCSGESLTVRTGPGQLVTRAEDGHRFT